MKNGPALLIFVKNPVAGKVKTRLAATVGNDEALRIYSLLLDIVHRITLPVQATKYVYYSDFVPESDLWNPTDFIRKKQQGATLGHRMRHALEEVLETHCQAILIGSDTPDITPTLLQQALEAVKQYPAVIGPALDGGYYLIGLNKKLPEIFEGIEWSTPVVFQQTVKILETMGLPFHQLPAFRDIDTEEDWRTYQKTASIQ